MKINTLLPVSSIMSYLSLKKVMWACKREGLRIYNTVNRTGFVGGFFI